MSSSPTPLFSPERSVPTSPTAQRSAYPFPRQVSTSRFRPRRGSTSSIASVSSIGGSLDIPIGRSLTVRETSQNAISTLLQPPIVRTGGTAFQSALAGSGFKAPTTKDIPPVTLTNIPHVAPDTFRDYLARIGPLFESFQRNRAEPEQASWIRKDKELDRTDTLAESLEKRLRGDGATSPTLSGQASNLSAAASPEPVRRRSSAQVRRNRNEPTPLSTIPPVYFEEDFHLENPRTFDIVSERAEIVRPPLGTQQPESKEASGAALPPRKALATNAILQEKLSWYMDTVEVHLIASIGSASVGFFAALGSLKELQTEAEQSIAKIQSLRADLRRLDREIACAGLEVATKKRRRANVAKLSRAAKQLLDVVENANKADELVEAEEYEKAAEQMKSLENLIQGRSEKDGDAAELLDLRSLRALQGMSAGLQDLRTRIGTGFAKRFTSILMTDLRQHVAKIPEVDTIKRWSRQRGIPPVYMETDNDFRQNLSAALTGLQKAGHTATAFDAYRDAVTKEMKGLIRKQLPSSNDDDMESMISISTRNGKQLSQQEKSTILARNLRALDAEDGEKLFSKIYASVSEALRRVSTQSKVLLDLTSNMQVPEPRISAAAPQSSPSKNTRSPQLGSANGALTNGGPKTAPEINVEGGLSEIQDMSALLSRAVEAAQTQIVRVLKVRNEQSVRLPRELFLRYINFNRLFADECEAISGEGGQALKGLINTQIQGFVQVLGVSETERIAQLLDNDEWVAIDFSDANEALVQRILKSMSSDPPEWSTTANPLWESPPAETFSAQSNGTADTNAKSAPANGTKAMAKPAQIDDTRFIMVASASSLPGIIDSFLSLTSIFPTMTPAISNSLLDVLRTFNSRSCQLILGAGATRSAGLKNITTKHLALASQALSFIIALVPYMRECVRRHLPAGQISVLAEFDKTKRLYQDHQSGIHDKLVDIMTSRSQSHVKALKALKLDETPDSTESKVSPYMETLTKETLTLHRVLNRHLGEVDVGMIMRQIFSSYKEQWAKAFGEIEVTTPHGEKQLLRDAECMEARLGKVEGFAEIGKEVVSIVKAKITDDGGSSTAPAVDEKATEKSEEKSG